MNTARKTPEWLSRGIVMAGGWDDINSQLRCAGDDTGYRRQIHAASHTAETVRRLKAWGVTLAITHLYQGMGVQAHREEMERTVAFAELCRQAGLRVGVYIGTISYIFYEHFFQELPEARSWLSCDQDGKIPNYGDLYFVPIICPNCEEYHRYLEQQVFTFAVEKVKADLIHLDNFRWWGEPEACRCPRCAAKFRAYLEERWPSVDQRYAHFGFTDFTYVVPPKFHWLSPPWKINTLADPLHRAWADFKCRNLAAIYQRYAEFCRKLNPEILMEHNADLQPGTNGAINRGAWPRWLHPHGDLYWEEGPEHSGLSPDGILVSKIRSFKAGQATRNRLFTYNFDPVSQAEAMAFNPGCLGMVGWFYQAATKRAPACLDGVPFFHRHIARLMPTESAAEVAVWYSQPTLTYTCHTPHLELLLAEQTLIQHQIPFDILYDEDLDRLNRYRVLILADVQLMTDDQIQRLSAFVRNGGGLILTRQTALATEHFQRRMAGPGFNDLLGADLSKFYKTPGKVIRQPVGRGRAAWFQGLEPAVHLDEEPAPTDWIRARYYDSRWWKMPKNHRQLAEAVQWVARELQLQVKAPPTVAVELRRQADRHCLYLHLVNYAPKPAAQAICRLRTKPAPGRRLTVFTFENPAGQPLRHITDQGFVQFTVKPLKRYALVEIAEA